jgi:hypothetical protein
VNAAKQIYQVFGDTTNAAVAYKLQSKLFDFGRWDTVKEALRFGLDIQSSFSISPTVVLDNEITSAGVSLTTSTAVLWLNNSLVVVLWTNSGANVVDWTTTLLLSLVGGSRVSLYGHYLGWTISGTDPPWRLGAAALEFIPRRPWSSG